MSAVAVLAHDEFVADTDDPHGLKARLSALGFKHFNKELNRLGLGSPNSITRALNSTARSDVRKRIEAYLAQREDDVTADPQTPGPGADILRIVGDARTYQMRLDYGRRGRVRRLELVLVDPDLSDEEIEAEVKAWREGGHE
jgi:hypothetical protein